MSRPRQKPVRWLLSAREEYWEIIERIAESAPRAAEKFARRLIARLELLSCFPRLGAICESVPHARFITHGKYILYYTVHRAEIVIRAMVHSARLFQRAWLRRRI